MKSTLTILFFTFLVGLTPVHVGSSPSAGAYRKVIQRLEACIGISSPNVLPFEFKNDLVKQLNALPLSYKDIYIGHDESLSDDVHGGPVTALTRTIETIFEEYKKRPNANLECLDIIQTVDPIGFIVYSNKNYGINSTAQSFESETLEFRSKLFHRRNLLNSKTDLSYIEPFQTNIDRQLHSIPDGVLAEVATEGAYLLDTSINYFVDIVNEHFKEQRMYYEFNYQIIENYKPYKSKKIDDVQILYGGMIGIGSIGHWICTYYKPSTRKLYVYDSLNPNFLGVIQKQIINRLYPKRKRDIIYVQPRNTQTDTTSCGIFAIYYATSLLMGQKPEDIDVKMNHVYGDSSLYMRLHLLKMFANRKLASFSQTYLSVKRSIKCCCYRQ